MKLNIPRRTSIVVSDLADASRQYAIARKDSGEGASTFPEGKIHHGNRTYRISYNGRVWEGETMVMEAQS